MGAVEGLAFDWTTDTLYWTCASAAAIRAVAVRAGDADTPVRAGRVRTVLRLKQEDRPRGIDVDPCEK